MQQAVAMGSKVEPGPLFLLLPVVHVFYNSYYNGNTEFIYSPDTGSTKSQPADVPYNPVRCRVDDRVTVLKRKSVPGSLELRLSDDNFWEATGNNGGRLVSQPSQPSSFRYLMQDGSCHEHWIVPLYSATSGDNPDNDPEPDDPDLAHLPDKTFIQYPPFNATLLHNSGDDLDATGNPIAALLPEPYPVRVFIAGSNKRIPTQSSLRVRDGLASSIILVPDFFPRLLPVSKISLEDDLQLFYGASNPLANAATRSSFV